jgi:hypothetical protein
MEVDISLGLQASSLDAREWDALAGEDDPFVEHAFLVALEASGSVGEHTGWFPTFVLARRKGDGRLVGALPAYLKTHSYGEFVFDWGWAEASARAGLPYYPKLVVTVPFTPASGRRWLVDPALSDAASLAVRQALLDGLGRLADDTGASSVHVLFCTAAESAWLGAHGYTERIGLQFHWRNRTPPFATFDDFLGAFTSRARKQTRRERAVAGSGLRLETRAGPELGPREWAALPLLYRANLEKHGSSEYLAPEFFDEVRRSLATRLVTTWAFRGDEPVAATINFEKGRHLYGRYWGATEEHAMLHFELSYYRLIEHAIARGHTLIEAGAGGEHKLKRGFAPALTHSAHHVRHPGLAAAVRQFCAAEAEAVRGRALDLVEHGPFHREPA